MLNEEIKNVLNSMKGDNAFEIFVIVDIIDNIDNYENGLKYLEEVIQHGCISGIVTSLITYKDTKDVFKKYFEEILDIYNDCQDNFTKEVNYNNLVWFAYEIVVDNIYYSNDIEEIKIEFDL